MHDDSVDRGSAAPSPSAWSKKKKDGDAPRGLFRHPSGVWGIRYTCAAGCVHQEKVTPLKGDAIEEYHKRRRRARNEPGWCPTAERRATAEAKQRQETERRQRESETITVQRYGDHWLKVHVAQECRERTARQYRSVLEQHVYPALGDVALSDLTRARIKAFLAGKAEAGLKRGTLKNIVVPLRAMLNEAVDEGRISGTPAAKLWKRNRGASEKEARKVTALRAEELGRLLAMAQEGFPDHSDFMHLLAWTGLRLSEACGLQWGDVDLGGGFLEVRRTASYRAHRILTGAPKSGKARRVDLPAALVGRLRARQSLREVEAAVEGRELSPWVFPAPSDESKPVNGAFIRFKVWYRLLRRAELRAVRLHDLRHTYASLLLQAGVPMIYVKEQLGHSSINVTVDLYGHVRPGENRAAVDRLAAATGAPGVPFNFENSSTSGGTAARHEGGWTGGAG
jgi:integrase